MTGRDMTTIETIDEAIRRMESEEEDEAWTWALTALRMAREEIERLRTDAGVAQAVAALLTTWKAQYAERKEHQSEWYAKTSHAEKQRHSNGWTVEFVLRDEAILNLDAALTAATAAALAKGNEP